MAYWTWLGLPKREVLVPCDQLRQSNPVRDVSERIYFFGEKNQRGGKSGVKDRKEDDLRW